MPTRRKSRSRTFPIILERQGVVENVNIDPAEFGVPLTFTHFEAPAHLSGRAYNSGIVLSGETTHFLPDKKHFENAIYAKFKPEKATYSFSYKPTNFARFLAKIAYGFVIAQDGLGTIKTPYVLDAILGRKDDIGRRVGCHADGKIHSSVKDDFDIKLSYYR